MAAEQNKQIVQQIFAALAKGDDRPFLDAMAEEMQWHWMGSGPWEKTFNGKAEVVGGLWAAVRSTLKPPYKAVARRIVADGDIVVVEAVGQNETPDGKIYNNRYCWVLRIEGGKIRELSEYMDTDLVTRTFL